MPLEVVTPAVIRRDAPKWRELYERIGAAILNGDEFDPADPMWSRYARPKFYREAYE